MLDAISRGSEPLLDNPLYTPLASLTLQGALDEAPPLGHNYIGTEHILLGLLRDRDGVGAGVLGDLGLSAEWLRTRLVEMVNALAAERRKR